MRCNWCEHADPSQKLCLTSREKKEPKTFTTIMFNCKSDDLLQILIGETVKESTYNITIRGPTYDIPFDCDISIWIKWIISF